MISTICCYYSTKAQKHEKHETMEKKYEIGNILPLLIK